jgi:D-methionine transport system permease protein
MINNLIPHVKWEKIIEATIETVYMTASSVTATFLFGIILGLMLFLTSKGNLLENATVYRVTAACINTFRSIPFIILVILLIPLTKILVGSILGANAALPALIIGAAPFYARMVELALREIDKGVIEASIAMGASLKNIIFKVLLPEAMPALVSGITVTAVALVGYTAMAGVIGAGGLGNLAYLEGFQRSHNDVTIVATIVILLIVFIIQFVGDKVTLKLDKR